MSRLRLGLLVLLALVICAAAFLLFSKQLTGENYLKEFVLDQLEESLGWKIDVRHVKLVVFPSIRVELSEVTIHDHHSDAVMLTAKRIDLVVRLLPLFRKQIVGKRLLIEEPNLTLRRNEAGQWNVLDGVSDQAEADQQTVGAMARMLMIREVKLVNGALTLVDSARPDGIRSLTLEQVNATLLIHPERGVADLHVSAAPPGERGPAMVSLDGKIRRSEKPVSLTEQAPAEPPLLFQFDGRLDAKTVNIRDAVEFLGSQPIPDRLQGALTLQSSVQVMPGVAGYDLVLSDISARLNEMALTGKANLAGLMTLQPTFAITLSSSLVSLAQLLNTVPTAWIDPQMSAWLADRQVDGKVQVMNATLTGTASAEAALSVTGEFRIQAAQGLIGQDRVAASDLAAVVSVEPGRMRITGVTGRYGTIRLTDGKAVVSFLEAGPWLELEVAGEMTAAHLVDFLAQTMKVERLTQVMAGVRDVEGLAQPTFRLVGALTQPGGITFAGGEIRVQSVSLTHSALPVRLTGLQGRFILAEGATQLEDVTGDLGDKSLIRRRVSRFHLVLPVRCP
ncbi:MAG: AsmA family protein [Nitrospira sp.]|nr:AsmA family protein [Nitrospira sp.]